MGVYYRTPGQNEQMDDEMLKEIREASKSYRTVIKMGDFNYPGIDWVSVTAGHAREIKFLDEINDRFLEQLVHEPTRGEAVLDLVLSGTQDLVQEIRVLGPLANSDHSMITFDLINGGGMVRKSTLLPFNFQKGDYDKMRKIVKKKLKRAVAKVKDLHQAWLLFKNKKIKK